MRVSRVILIAATVTLFTSGNTAIADSDISTVTASDEFAAIGAQDIGDGKRFLRYYTDGFEGDEIEEEDRGLFEASSLKALTREALDLKATALDETSVLRFFNTLVKRNYTPVNVPIPEDYTTLRQLYHNWYYDYHIRNVQLGGT